MDDEEFDQNQGRGGNYQVFRGDSLEALEAWDESEMDDVEDANENFQAATVMQRYRDGR